MRRDTYFPAQLLEPVRALQQHGQNKEFPFAANYVERVIDHAMSGFTGRSTTSSLATCSTGAGTSVGCFSHRRSSEAFTLTKAESAAWV
jgi:hypothetical protein